MGSHANTGAPKTYVQGKAIEVDHHHHVMPLKTYFVIFFWLMVLTVITVAVSYMGLGSASLFVAMVVALVKAGLVVGYFMHLKYDDRFLSFIFFGTLIFVVIFFVLTFADLATRDKMVREWDNHTLVEEKFESDAKLKEARESFKAGAHSNHGGHGEGAHGEGAHGEGAHGEGAQGEAASGGDKAQGAEKPPAGKY